MQPSIVVFALRIGIFLVLFAFVLFIVQIQRKDLFQKEEALWIPPANLFLTEGPEIGRIYPLEESNLLGRGQACTIQIDEPTISATHARLTYASKQWILEDLGSRNGTLINEIPVEEPMQVVYGDRIHFGNVMVLFTSRIDPPTQPEQS